MKEIRVSDDSARSDRLLLVGTYKGINHLM
jgi:hypothetical protein